MTRKQKSKINKAKYRRATKTANYMPVEVKRRKSTFDPKVADEILERVACGDTLKGACRELDVNEATMRYWIRNDLGGNPGSDPPLPGLFARYARAREAQAEAWSDDLIDIADRRNWDPNDRRIRIETRKWLMGKNHIRFTDKLTLEGGAADKPIRTITSTMSPREAQEAYAEQLKRSGRPH